jgi:hypothetical protein
VGISGNRDPFSSSYTGFQNELLGSGALISLPGRLDQMDVDS